MTLCVCVCVCARVRVCRAGGSRVCGGDKEVATDAARETQ